MVLSTELFHAGLMIATFLIVASGKNHHRVVMQRKPNKSLYEGEEFALVEVRHANMKLWLHTPRSHFCLSD